MKFFNLRSDVVAALKAEDAVRSHEIPRYDTFKRAITAKDLATALQLHCSGYEDLDVSEIGRALGDLARNDAIMRQCVNFIGGANHEPWNHWEWSLPPSMIEFVKSA